MHEAQTKAPQNGKPESAGESSCASCSDLVSPAYVQMMPAYALGQGVPGVSLFGSKLQTKLTVGRPDDAYEREADSVAQRVTNGQPVGPISALSTGSLTKTAHRQIDEVDDQIAGPTLAQTFPLQRQAADEEVDEAEGSVGEVAQPLLQKKSLEEDEESGEPEPRSTGDGGMQLLPGQSQTAGGCSACNVQRLCTECEEREQQEQGGEMVQKQSASGPAPGDPELEEQRIQSKGDQSQAATVTTSVAASVNSLNGGGSALPERARAYFEPRFGADFSQVRTHTDSGAAQAAKSLRARAFTVGENIAFGAGEYAPDSHDGRLLLAHELTHVVQQGAAGSRDPVAHTTDAPRVQRALFWQFEGVSHLLIWVRFGDEMIFHELTLEPDVANFFSSDPHLAQNVENTLEQIFNPPDRPLHETAAYLQSGAVLQQVVRGVRQLVTQGRTDFSDLVHRLTRRTDLFYEQNLLPAATDHLAAALGIGPATIDWNVLLPGLRERTRSYEPESIVDAALRDRYEMFLDMLGNEAGALPPVVGAAAIDPASADRHLFQYVSNAGSSLFTEDVYAYHSEKFVNEYLPALEALRYVPEQFDLQAFQPSVTATWRIDDARERIVADFIAREAESRVLGYVLDRWTISRATPEEFLGTLDLEQFRDEITSHLAAELLSRARRDPELMAALRSRAVDQARFMQVAWLVGYGHDLERHNRSLAGSFGGTPISELSSEDLAIASNPFEYYNTSLQVSRALYDLFNRLSPNAPIELQIVDATASMLRALDMSASYAPLFLLTELLSYLAAFRNSFDEQERETQRILKERLDLDFDRIATIVRGFAEHADRFIRDVWVPMLKQIAIEYATQNRDDILYRLENWESLRRQDISQAAEGAAEFEFLANQLESGRAEAVEVEGQSIRRDGIPQLRNAAKTMRAIGLNKLDNFDQAMKRVKLAGAVSDYGQVIEDIVDGTYNPLDYSSAVYAEARRRLHIEAIEGFMVGTVLRREVVARSNPFLEYAIVRWQYFEGLERSMDEALTLLAMGILTVAAALVPGAVGLILKAIDIVVSVRSAVKGVYEARDTLRMARLDIYGTIVGVTEAQAEEALDHAWINLGVTLVLNVGLPALQVRAFLRDARGVRVPRVAGAARLSRAESGLLRETSELHGAQLGRQQLNAEAEIAARSPSRPSSLRGFDEEVRLANDHVWRRRGSSWCRFSLRPFCMPDATLPTALRRRAFRNVASTLDEGFDATGRVVPNRGHSFSDHGAQTTPAQHARRLIFGVSPGGRVGIRPPSSSRFFSHQAHLNAYQLARDDLAAHLLNTRGAPVSGYGGMIPLRDCGTSYRLVVGGGGRVIETTANRFYFYFERNASGFYDLITMYPKP